ncbi:MAG: GGDEF domain-containing protein [Sinimarinibacterium sp.]|jgi:diguanylate cyclase (GGDEF)-like protein
MIEAPPSDLATAEAEIARLKKVVEALMDRAERFSDAGDSAFGSFQTSILLESEVRRRTGELEAALRENEQITRSLERVRVTMEREIEQRRRSEVALLVLQKTLQEQALHDGLTQLYNRRYLDEIFERELARTARDREPLSVVMADLDHFKTLNDTYGHMAGDEVLKAFAKLLVARFRRSDICCRYGGEEFLVLMPGTDEEAALQRVEQVRRALEDLSILWGGATMKITASFGVAVFPAHGATAPALIAAADAALYAAKRSGRNRVLSRSVCEAATIRATASPPGATPD